MPANEIDSLSSLPSTFCSGYSAILRDASGTTSPGARLPQLPCARALCRLTSLQWGVTGRLSQGRREEGGAAPRGCPEEPFF